MNKRDADPTVIKRMGNKAWL